MACNNCFNGCADTISDKCVKYTGVDIPALGIENGDSLAVVEAAIFEFLVPVLDGSGIKPLIDNNDICELVEQYLPPCVNCNGFTLNEILTAIIKAICDLQQQVIDTNDRIDIIEADYDIECLVGVEPSSGTHNILQAVITKLCSLDEALADVIADLVTNYVRIDEVNNYIEAYLENLPTADLISNKMVPYCPIPYIGPLTPFDLSGAGIGNWLKVYLCNGNNGTPDYRGRGLVGATTMGTNPFNPAVDPAITGNPSYALGTMYGANIVALNAFQIPVHTHSAVSVVTDPGHFHNVPGGSAGNNYVTLNDGNGTGINTDTKTTGITVETTIGSTGAGQAHNNVQPSQAVYFIIYIP